MCGSPRDHKELDINEQLNGNNNRAPASTPDATRTDVSLPPYLDNYSMELRLQLRQLDALCHGLWLLESESKTDQLDLNTAEGIRFETSAA